MKWHSKLSLTETRNIIKLMGLNREAILPGFLHLFSQSVYSYICNAPQKNIEGSNTVRERNLRKNNPGKNRQCKKWAAGSGVKKTKLNNFKKIFVVLGNESCDLDSAICTLVHGLWHHDMIMHENVKEIAVIPVLNVAQHQFNIKTEVIYHLNLNKIPLELLTFRDEIDLVDLNKRQVLALSLVDHHTLNDHDAPLATSVVEVIDHRPQDPNWPWTACDINLKKVGSCATLIAQNILEKNPQLLDQHISNLLTGPILIDTCNFSESAARATSFDFEIMHELELIAGIASPIENRCKIYSEILNAKSDISALTPFNLLEKDLKCVNGIPIPGLPMLVEEFLNLNGAMEAVNSFTRARECRLIILLGMDLKGNVMKRDCAVFSFLPNDLENRILVELFNYNDGELALSLVTSTSQKNWCLKLYKQANVRATRKQILPIIQRASAGWHC